jgi:hypothetical protein
MKHQTINLVKFKSLAKRLNSPLYRCVGVLESLWLFAQFQARDGDLSRFSHFDIAAWLEWEGDPDLLIQALIDTRWLDQDGDVLVIHDWVDHRPNWLRGVAEKARRRGEPLTESGPVPGSEPSAVPGTGPSTVPGSEPSAVPPETRDPRPETKNNGRPLGSSGREGSSNESDGAAKAAPGRPVPNYEPIRVDVALYGRLKDAAQSIADTVSPEPRKPLRCDDRELCIRIAAAATERIGGGWLEGILASYRRRSRPPDRRWAWLRTAAINSAKEAGWDFHRLEKSIEIPASLAKPNGSVKQ